MSNQRVFDFLRHQLANYPKADCLSARKGKDWQRFNTQEVLEIVDRLSQGLLKLGIRRGDTVALIANNCPEWHFIDFALQQIGAVSVPLYPTLTLDDMRFIVQHAEIRLAFAGDKALYGKLKDATQGMNCPVYTFENVEGAANWEELLMAGGDGNPEVLAALRDSVRPDDLLTIIYTSGTTGRPKGVMLSHRNVVSQVEAVCRFVKPLVPGQWRTVSFLPLSHVFERTACYFYISAGVSIYYAKSMDVIAASLQDVHPQMFTTVPRLLEKVYEKFVSKSHELKGVTRKLYEAALRFAESFEPNTPPKGLAALQYKLYDKLVYSKWRAAMGNEVQVIVVGSAALQPRLARVFWAAGIMVTEGYGMTESAPVLTGNQLDAGQVDIGTVGIPLDNVEIRIAEDGEILARGPNVMMGYYKDEEMTRETLKDGWLHTGDVGEINARGNLRITDRKKEMFKTSCGKYVAPQVIENKLKESAYIDQVMVVGDGRKYASALVVPLFDQVRAWCSQQGLHIKSEAEMASHPKVRELIEHEVKRFNRLFGSWEQVKKVALVERPWSIDAGELAPTLKLKRKVITERFRKLIDSLYPHHS